MSLREVHQYVEENKQRFIERLREFCRQPSVSITNNGIKECAALLQKMMSEVGITNRLIELPDGHPVVFGEVKSKRGDKTLLLYNHYDVQPPEPLELWTSPPFSAEIRDGFIYARGIADNKGALIARLNVVEAFLKTLGEVPLNLKFVAEGEEEMGSPHLEYFLQEHRDSLKAEVALWEGGSVDAEGRPIASLGNKGILYVELRTKGAKSDLHSSEAVIVPNPAWRLVWALNALKDEDEKIMIEGFYDGITPYSEEEMEVIRKAPYDEEARKSDRGIDRFLLGLTGEELKVRLLTQPTCTICGILAGYTGKGLKTVLPSEAMVKIDFRLVPDQRPQDILGKVKKHLAKHGFSDISVEGVAQLTPSRTTLTNKYAAASIRILEEEYGKQPVIQLISPGSGPRYLFEEGLGLPVVSGGGVGHLGSRIHAPNENITVEDFIRGMRANAALFDGLGKV